MTAQKLTNDQKQMILTGLIIVLAVFVLYKISKPFADMIDGIKDVFGKGSEAKAAEEAVKAIEAKGDTGNPFSPRYLADLQNKVKSGTVIHYMKGEKVAALADKIYKAGGKWAGGVITGALIGAKPSDLIDVFKQVNYKSQVSQIAAYFQKKYGKDMLTYITTGLRENQPLSQTSDSEIITQIINRVASLPAY